MTVLRGASVRPAASMDARPHPGVEQRREANGTDVRRFVGSAHAQSPRQSERCAALGRQRRLTGSLRSPETARIRPPYPRGNPAPRAIGHNAVSNRVRLTCMPRASRGANVGLETQSPGFPRHPPKNCARPVRSGEGCGACHALFKFRMSPCCRTPRPHERNLQPQGTIARRAKDQRHDAHRQGAEAFAPLGLS
jgi:hypothetical protein